MGQVEEGLTANWATVAFLAQCGKCNLGLEERDRVCVCVLTFPALPARRMADIYYGAGCTLANRLNFGVHL
jgi:hypothetical protein